MSNKINIQIVDSYSKREESVIYKKSKDDLTGIDFLFDLDENELAFINYNAVNVGTIIVERIMKKAEDIQNESLHCY